MAGKPHVVWFKDVDKNDVGLVGGKGANLGEMVSFNLPVPDGFIVTSPAYFYVLEENHLKPKIKNTLEGLDVHDPTALNRASKQVKKLISSAHIPKDLQLEILKAYDKLGHDPLVAIRSSATAEDLPDASFAGQQETFLNIKGDANVVSNVREAWASLFEPRAIFYREQKGFDHFKVGIAVPVQKMVQSDVSGVLFTINPVTNDKKTLVIEAIWGLGEKIVQGAITPDHYQVNTQTWDIVKKQLVEQRIQLIKKGDKNVETSVPRRKQKKYKLSDKKIIELAKIGKKIHRHYFFPQDIEWATEKNKFFILQTRPITTIEAIKAKSATTVDSSSAIKNLKKLLTGKPASPGLVSGKVRHIPTAKDIARVKQGEIMVTSMTTPDFVPAMKKAAALITDKGGQTSHAAIVSRELGLPCIVGTKTATKVLKPGKIVTINGKTGEIYAGSLPAKTLDSIKIQVKQKKSKLHQRLQTLKTATKLYVNLGESSRVDDIAAQNVDGVGLLRAEFMISEIGIHPRKLIKSKKQSVFIDKLTQGLTTFCQAFNPRPVIYRTTDFKTNEYKNLKGGTEFEPEEANPLMGFRGAGRYIKDEQVFELELKAIKKVRNKQNLRNLWVMIPFVRTVEEMKMVKKIIAANGLQRSPSFQLWMMVEVPSNVIILEDFIKTGIDGISIGTNDLTMLILGADRDNELIADKYHATDPAVLWAIKQTITKAKKHGVSSSMCGQAPSIYPQLVKKLVNWGITSISINPDAIDATRQLIYQAESDFVNKKSK